MLLILVLKSKPFIWYILHSFFMISCANHQMHKPLLWDFHGPPLHACRQTLKLLIVQYYAAGFFFRNRTAIFSTQIDVRWHSAKTGAHSALAPQDRRQRPTSCRCAAWLAPARGRGEQSGTKQGPHTPRTVGLNQVWGRGPLQWKWPLWPAQHHRLLHSPGTGTNLIYMLQSPQAPNQ